MKDAYRFVHLSDIHFGQERNGTLKTHDDVRRELLQDCREMRRQLGPADGILVTGDVAFGGKEHEYQRAGEWLNGLAEAVGCERTAVRTIPGNHDVDRDKIDRFGQIAHTHLRNVPLASLDGELEAMAKANEESNSLLPKLSEYRLFASRYGCNFRSAHEPYWRKDYPLGRHYRLALVGLTSVQVCDRNDAEGQMVLGNSQYIIGREDNVEFVVLLHHPLLWFRDRQQAAPYLKRARVIMVGHEHMLEIRKVTTDTGGEQLEIYAGATNPPETAPGFPYRYNWLKFALAEGPRGRLLRVTSHPRVWEYGQTKFIPDLARLGNQPSSVIEILCPQFLGPPAGMAAVDASPANDEQSQQEGSPMSEREAHDFERLQYFFWTYLDWHDRLKALVEIDVLPATRTQPVPQTLEQLALDQARSKRKLGELWDVVMRTVPEESREPNPFVAREAQ